MCEFCTTNKNLIEDKELGKLMSVTINYLGGTIPTLRLYSDENSDKHITNMHIPIIISYCPKCGKKL